MAKATKENSNEKNQETKKHKTRKTMAANNKAYTKKNCIEIAKMIKSGATTEEINAEFGICKATIKRYMGNHYATQPNRAKNLWEKLKKNDQHSKKASSATELAEQECSKQVDIEAPVEFNVVETSKVEVTDVECLNPNTAEFRSEAIIGDLADILRLIDEECGSNLQWVLTGRRKEDEPEVNPELEDVAKLEVTPELEANEEFVAESEAILELEDVAESEATLEPEIVAERKFKNLVLDPSLIQWRENRTKLTPFINLLKEHHINFAWGNKRKLKYLAASGAIVAIKLCAKSALEYHECLDMNLSDATICKNGMLVSNREMAQNICKEQGLEYCSIEECQMLIEEFFQEKIHFEKSECDWEWATKLSLPVMQNKKKKIWCMLEDVCMFFKNRYELHEITEVKFFDADGKEKPSNEKISLKVADIVTMEGFCDDKKISSKWRVMNDNDKENFLEVSYTESKRPKTTSQVATA